MRYYFKYLIYLFVFTWFSSAYAGSYDAFFTAILQDNPAVAEVVLVRGAGYSPAGDLVSADVAREAAEEGNTFLDHYAHMVAHGFLHILGYDHEDDREAEIMEARERAILKRLGIADPYLPDSRIAEPK